MDNENEKSWINQKWHSKPPLCALSKLAEEAKIRLVYMFGKVAYAGKSFIWKNNFFRSHVIEHGFRRPPKKAKPNRFELIRTEAKKNYFAIQWSNFNEFFFILYSHRAGQNKKKDRKNWMIRWRVNDKKRFKPFRQNFALSKVEPIRSEHYTLHIWDFSGIL